MTTYTCPMHPEIKKDKPGKCSKCGMDLVAEGKSPIQSPPETSGFKAYIPLIVVIGLIALTTLALAFNDLQMGIFSLSKTISYFMIGFFITFAGFKLMDLQGFVHGYSTYDLLAMKLPPYGYIYPFIELFFGLAMIFNHQSIPLLWSEIIVMGFSGLGVALKLLKREKFYCVCLGTFLKVPLTKVTLVEDFGMAALATIMLLLR